jgi:hypothetical protein
MQTRPVACLVVIRNDSITSFDEREKRPADASERASVCVVCFLFFFFIVLFYFCIPRPKNAMRDDDD